MITAQKGSEMKKELFSQARRDLFSKIFIAGTGSLALLSLTGCGGSDNTSDTNTTDTNTTDTTTVLLTDEQKATILYMYQEEKVARDVYIWMDDIYGTQTNTFANIILSEQQHMDAVEKLCIKYDIDISAVDENAIGVFILPELQDLYDTLYVQDNTLEEALNVGVLIEETDITDLEEAAAGMPDDVVSVFENLKEGSLNHLGAFTYALSQLP